MLNPMI